eukprot:876434_1
MSMSKLKDIKFIPKSTKYIVFGYNKRIEEILQSNIPILINSLCILYYFESDYFEIAGSGITISEDKKSITKTKTNGWGSYDNTSYLSMSIASSQSIYYIWTIKIQSSSGMINIGITSNNEIDKNFTAWRHDDNYSSYSHYAYNGYMGYKSSNNGISPYSARENNGFCNGDIIDIHLDLSKKK